MDVERTKMYLVKRVRGGGYKTHTRKAREEQVQHYLDEGWGMDPFEALTKELDRVFKDFKNTLDMLNGLKEGVS